MFTEPSSTSSINVNVGNKVFKIASNTDDKETKYSWDDKFLDSEIRNYFGRSDYGIKDMSKLINALHKYDQSNVNDVQDDFSAEEFQAVKDEADKGNAEALGLAKIKYENKQPNVKGHGNYKPNGKDEWNNNYDAGKWNSPLLGNYRYLPTIEDVKEIIDADKMIDLADLAENIGIYMGVSQGCYGGFRRFMQDSGYTELMYGKKGDIPGSRGYNAAAVLEQFPDLFEEVYVEPEDVEKLPAGFFVVYDDSNGTRDEAHKGTYCGHIGFTIGQNSANNKKQNKSRNPFQLLPAQGYEANSVVGHITRIEGPCLYKRYRVFAIKKQTPQTEVSQKIALSEEAPKVD